MGKIKEFSIHLNEGKQIYFAGEEIKGNVSLNLAAPMQMFRIIVLVEGKARCTVGDPLSEKVLNKNETLFGVPIGSSDSSNTEHPPGISVYPFTFLLPEELPSSVEENHGIIKYKITARIIFKGLKGLISKDWKIIMPIIINEVIDGNTTENQNPVKDVMRRTPGFFTKQKNIQQEDLLVTLEHSMYCPGEEAKVTIKYKDVNARKMGNIKSKLNKYVLFNPKQNKRRHASRKIIKEIVDIKKKTERIYQRILTIPIPEGTPPTNVQTKSIKLNYTIHIKIDGYPELKLPLTIGTKPLMYTQENAQQAEQPNASYIQHCESTAEMNYAPPPYFQSSSEWTPDFIYTPDYVPENEFDFPPSYEDATGWAVVE